MKTASQAGLPISNAVENLNAKAIQQISIKKMGENKTENKIATSDAWQLSSANRNAISFSLAG